MQLYVNHSLSRNPKFMMETVNKTSFIYYKWSQQNKWNSGFVFCTQFYVAIIVK